MREKLPFDMFDEPVTALSPEVAAREARRAKRMESIYHVGQDRIWDGRSVLADLIQKHGAPQLAARERKEGGL